MKKEYKIKIFVSCVVVFNLLFAVIIIGLVRWKLSEKGSAERQWIVSAPGESNITSEQELELESEERAADDMYIKEYPVLSEAENYKNIYMAIIPGTYEPEDGIVFNFYEDGKYDGFFDSENLNVSGYIYDIVGEIGKESYIEISDPTYTKKVSYKVDFNQDGKIILFYGEDRSVELGY